MATTLLAEYLLSRYEVQNRAKNTAYCMFNFMALAQVDSFSNSEENSKGYVSYSPRKPAFNVGRK